MMGRERQRRLAVWMPRALMVLGASFVLHVVAACQGTRLSGPEVIACTEKAPCPCEQDPTQNMCKGFNDRPETGPVIPVESGPGVDAADANDGAATGDASSDDASDDGGDGGD